MKHKLLILLFPVILNFGCKKNEIPVPELGEVRQAVTFSVSTKASTTNTLADSLSALRCVIIDSKGVIVDYVSDYYDVEHTPVVEYTQVSPFSMGVKTTLRPGNYQAIFLSGQYYIDNSGHVATSYIRHNNSQDVFYARTDFTVGSEAVTKAVTLERITAGLEIHLTDSIIPPGQSITVFYWDDNRIHLDGSTSESKQRFHGVQDVHFIDDTFYETGRKINFYSSIANTTRTSSITISFGSGENDFKTISNVRFEKNKKTILTGKLFGVGAGFKASIQPLWDSPAETVNF